MKLMSRLAGIFGVMFAFPAWAGPISIGTPLVALTYEFQIAVVADCSVYEGGEYPGDSDLLVSCPELERGLLLRALSTRLAEWTILSIAGDKDPLAEAFLGGSSPLAQNIQGGRVRGEGPLTVEAKFKVIAVKK